MIRKSYLFYIISGIALILALPVKALAQRKQINVEQSDLWMHSNALGSDIVHVIGNVIFEHEGARLYCDSAWLYEKSNSVDCYGNVRIKSSDTLNLFGKLLHYDGNTRIATIQQSVRLVDKQGTLSTEYMVFDRNTGIANYTNGGKMVNEDNVLTSKRCYYHTDTKLMYFKDDVVLTNPDYKIKCDTLKYNTKSRISYFLGPTIITGKDNYIYCEDGEYSRETNKARFSVNALMVDDNRRLTGDSLYYDNNTKYGKAINHVVMTDTAQHIIVKGNFAEYWRNKGYTLITDRAMAIMGDKKDTLYLHADTLKATFDTARNETRELFAYHHAKFYRTDMQGACDSLYFSFADSLITLYHLPVLWSDMNQLTADTIRILTGKNSIKQLFLYSTSFIVSHDSLDYYNQIRGKNMIGYLTDNELKRIDVNGNAETVYYIRENDKSLTGVNKAQGSKMSLYVVNNKIERIVYFDKPNGSMYPDKDFPADQRLLKGFSWRLINRPMKKEDIFKKAKVEAEEL